MVGQIIKHAELDRYLDQFAQDPESFEREALKLAADFDAKGIQLEISDPLSWRKDNPSSQEPTRTSVESQLRSEIESIKTLDRTEESRLARRIEFARLRLKLALTEAGLSCTDLEGGACSTPSAYMNLGSADRALPPKVCRLWSELHALRTEMVERNLYLVLINVERYSHTTASQRSSPAAGATRWGAWLRSRC